MKRIGKHFLFVVAVAALAIPATTWAQSFQAQITGGGGSGKCTFEVAVNGMNGVAEVEIRNNQGYLKTLNGQQAQWRRLVCNQPLPRNPNNFRFKGIDGHGKQYLVRDPNSNGGTAVVRIENNRNGYEGYTGDILWDGGGNSGGGWNNGGNNNNWGNNNNNWGNNNNNWGNNSGNWTVQNAYYGTNSNRKNVTGTVRNLVRGPDFRVSNSNMGGDPAVGADKTLYINARSSNGQVQTFTYREGATVSTQMFNGGGGGGWGNNNQWNNNNNNWNQNTVRNNCQNAIRSQLVGQYGGYLNFNGNPSQVAAGGGVRVQGTANFRDRNGKTGNIEYKCAVDTNGTVRDAKYQVAN